MSFKPPFARMREIHANIARPIEAIPIVDPAPVIVDVAPDPVIVDPVIVDPVIVDPVIVDVAPDPAPIVVDSAPDPVVTEDESTKKGKKKGKKSDE